MKQERGEGKLGCLILILVLGLVAFLSFKILPVYVDKISLEDELTRIVNRAASSNWSDRRLTEQVVSSVREGGFAISREDVEISQASRFQSASRLRVRLKYRRPVTFFGYEYVFEFSPEMTGLVGRLR